MANNGDDFLQYNAPNSLDGMKSHQYLVNIPVLHKHQEEECPICLDAMSSQGMVALKGCGHEFHRVCILGSLERLRNCPMCKDVVFQGEPQGHSPSGTMSITRNRQCCAGFSPGCIQIQYTLHGGVQKKYHDNPGVPFSGTTRHAYIPDNDEGKALLRRLKYAFVHGLTFRVGTSLTTGQANVVTWASIHHKTSLNGGSYGFPDPTYLRRCNEELDQLRVPSAENC